MAEQTSLVFKICERISKYSLLAAIFLVPLFFLPWTSEALDFNKQAVAGLLLAVSMFSWMIKALVSGKFHLNLSKINIAIGAFFLIYILSTLFSVNRQGSFWGWPQLTADSLISLIIFTAAYFLALNLFSKRDVYVALSVFLVSAFVAQIIGILQILGVYLPFSFAASPSFNTIGTPGALGFFSAIILCITIAMMVQGNKWQRIFSALQIFASAVILFLVNFPMIWWTVILGMAIILIFGVIKRDLFDGRWLALPMFFLAISLFFALLNPQIPGLTQKTNEVFLSQEASLKIAEQALRQNPILGSGPGTFSYDFSKFKNQDFSKTSLWSIVFPTASSKVLTDLATTGILGILGTLALCGFIIFYGIKYLFFDKFAEESKNFMILALGLFAALVSEILMFFFYNANFVLGFAFFVILGCFVNIATNKGKQYGLKSSSITTLITAFAFALIFTFGLGILFLGGQRYIAEIYYYNGLNSLQQNDIDAGIKNIGYAASLNPHSDLYLRQLSVLYLAKISNELQNISSEISDDQKNELQQLLANSVNAARAAADINPNNAINLSTSGYVYQNLLGLIPDADKWALQQYDEALKIDPNNPYIWMQRGNVSLMLVQRLSQDQLNQKNQLLSDAQKDLEKATELNPNYSDALYSLGLVYDAQGSRSKAIETFTLIKQLNPDDKTIAQILINLNAGRSAFNSQSTPPASQTPPESAQDAGNSQTQAATEGK